MYRSHTDRGRGWSEGEVLARGGGLLAVVGTSGLLLVGTKGCSATAHRIHQAFRGACSEQVPV